MPENAEHQAAPVQAVAAPPAAIPAAASSMSAPMVARSRASAVGNAAFARWANSSGAAGAPLPSLSARDVWGPPVLSREPAGSAAPAPAAAPAAPAADDDTEEPIEVKGMKLGKQVLDGVIPAAGGDLTKTFAGHIGHQASFGPYGLQVPLVPGIFAGFGAGGAMSAKADGSLTLTGTNILHAAMGSKKQELSATGAGTASGTIAGSLTAGLKIGIPGALNVGVYGQGTLAFRAEGEANFAGSLKRFKPKGESAFLPWSGDITFDAHLRGSLIAEAAGYFEYQVLWIIRDQFGNFKIGQWTLADAGLDIKGTMGPGRPLQVTIKPWVGPMLQPTVTQELRARTDAEREKAKSLSSAGAAGAPVARKRRLMRDEAPPPPTPPPDDAAGGAQAPSVAPPEQAPAGGQPAPGGRPHDAAALQQAAGLGGPGGGGATIVLPAEPKIEEE
jgi:hypothetical protein